jgi:chromosome segregation ATPase
VSAIPEFGQRVEAARHTLRQIEQQHSKYNEDFAGLLKEVAECANLRRAEMMESKAQYEHIMDEYAQLKDLLHSPVLTSGAGLHGSLGDIIRDLDAEVGDPQYPAAANVTLMDQAAVLDENIAETDPVRFRGGLNRALKKGRTHAVKAEESSDLGS